MFYIEFKDKGDREAFRSQLLANQVTASSHYQPLDTSQMGRKTLKPSECKNSKYFAETILRFPVWIGLQNSGIFSILEEQLNPIQSSNIPKKH